MSRILFQSVLLIGIIFGSDRKVFFKVSSTELHYIFLIFPIYISSQPPPSFRHLRDEMPPPLSGEASRVFGLQQHYFKRLVIEL